MSDQEVDYGSRPDTGNPTISVVIVNYCGGSMLRETVGRLHNRQDIEVIVVDNASNDNSMEMLCETRTSARLIYNESNVGFARAVNRGARDARGKYICLLNPDTIVSADALIDLAFVLEEDEELGVVAPLIGHPGGIKVMEAGWEPSLRHLVTHVAGLTRLAHKFPALRGFHARPSQVGSSVLRLDWVSGALLVTRADVWKSLGGLDERWFMYTEDVEYCSRLRREGYAVGVASWIEAQHAVGSSAHVSSDDTGPAARGRRPTDTLWVTTLYEYYRDELSKSRAGLVAWTLVLCFGLSTRIAIFQIAAQTTRSKSAASRYRFLAKKFQWSLIALLLAAKQGSAKC